jgi:hypothetical protein
MFPVLLLGDILFTIISSDSVQENLKHLIDRYNFRLYEANSTVSFLIGIDPGKAKITIGINMSFVLLFNLSEIPSDKVEILNR